jgi:phenylacetate-CoA ligase
MVYAESVLDEIVITNLKNRMMPLLRYKTGDLGNIKRTDQGMFIENLRGRVHDSVTINGTVYLTHYIQDLLDRFGGVADFQILTKENAHPILRIVLDENANKEKLENDIRAIFQNHLPIEYISMDDLKLVGRRHKFRYVVNE